MRPSNQWNGETIAAAPGCGLQPQQPRGLPGISSKAPITLPPGVGGNSSYDHNVEMVPCPLQVLQARCMQGPPGSTQRRCFRTLAGAPHRPHPQFRPKHSRAALGTDGQRLPSRISFPMRERIAGRARGSVLSVRAVVPRCLAITVLPVPVAEPTDFLLWPRRRLPTANFARASASLKGLGPQLRSGLSSHESSSRSRSRIGPTSPAELFGIVAEGNRRCFQ